MSEEYYILALYFSVIGSVLLVVGIYSVVFALQVIAFSLGKITSAYRALYQVGKMYDKRMTHINQYGSKDLVKS